jgi:hypothetical protein
VHFRAQGLRRGGDARNEPAAADRHHQHVEVGHLLQHLEAHRALAGDHRGVVVGVDEGEAFARAERVRVLRGPGERVALEDHVGAVHLRALHLVVRGAARHHDHRAHAQARRVVGDALRVVAGAHGDDAAPALGLGQREQLVERAALLERGGELQVLELEPQLAAGERRQGAAAQARRALHRAGDARGGCPDIAQRNFAHAASLAQALQFQHGHRDRGRRHWRACARAARLARLTCARLAP